MNVHELLRLLQTEHDDTAARADHLREQIERLTTALAETEARPTGQRPPRRPRPPTSAS